MSLRSRATGLIALILVAGVIVLGGLHYFAEHGQWTPASSSGGATKSDQRDSAVSNDVANHKR